MNIPLVLQNRKRCRNMYEDDASDFMPLSKRINNLHINNALQAASNAPDSMNVPDKSPEWGPGPPVCYDERQLQYEVPQMPDVLIRNPEWVQNFPQYNPELNESQNPYYYNNKLLYHLFVERMQRSGQSFH